MNLNLQGKRTLVTGSSKGIGEAIVRTFASEGAVAIVHGRDIEKTERVASDIVDQGGQAYAVFGDLADDNAVERLVAEAEKLAGPIEILVNNAGGSGGAKDSWDAPQPTFWSSAYDRNVLAALRVTRLVLPGMREAKWGRIINISSLAATVASPNGAHYSAAKAALNAMTASLAKADAGNGITVNAISPGTIRSGTLEARFREVALAKGLAEIDTPWEEVERAILPLFAQVPVGRVGSLDEIAHAVVFLASPAASYITGINLRVDGGLSPSF
jgi:NAD(P)-dependent dehydrogenase (short-subunit alcohol dehydrogenase family)